MRHKFFIISLALVIAIITSLIVMPTATQSVQAFDTNSSTLAPGDDTDQDGLTDDQEIALGTDPNNADSDCDNIDDGTEVGNPPSPTNTDGDGVINALENNLADSDQDTLKDHQDSSAAVQVTCGRFKPFAIFNNGTDSTRLEVRVTGGNNITAVTLQAPTAFTGSQLRLDGTGITSLQLIPLYDDGDFANHGDVRAGDGVWSRKGFTSVYTPYYWSHEFSFQRFIVTDNSGNNNIFWFGSGTPFPGVSHYISIGVVRSTEIPTIYPIKTGVQATSNLINIVNPKGSLDPKANRGTASAQLFYNTLPGDDYDFLVFYPDSHMPVAYAAMNHPVQNSVQNIGRSTFNNTSSYGSSGRLQSLVLTNFQYTLPLLHEIMHQWWSPDANPLSGLGFHQCIDASHWGVSGVGNGQLGGFNPATLVSSGGGVYQVGGFNLNHNGGDSVIYAPLELYLAGFMPSGSVSNITNPVSVNCSSLSYVGGSITSFSAAGLATVTIDQVKTALGGERIPSYATSQKNFKAAMVIISQDLLTAAEMAFYNSQAKNLGAVTGSYDMKSFREATLGVATLDTTIISMSGPEINVKWTSGPSIASGDNTPSAVDGTDFGSADISGGTVVRTFTIENMGNASLTLSGTPMVAISGAHAADFSVTASPTSPIITGGSTTFSVTFDPSASGLRTAIISIANNDSNENPYTFSIQGTGTITLPGAFGKTSPANGATGVSTSPTLSWSASSGATSYEYCYDTSGDNACSGWTGNGTATSKALSGLTPGTTYYWHVRANNPGGTTYADGSATAFWSFTTGSPPAAFSKSSPTNGASNQPTSLALSWGTSTGATSYEYCYDTSNDGSCSGAWVSTGTSTGASLSGLAYGTTYYWQVRASNSFGTTFANGSATAFWAFTTGSPPAAFSKNSPTNGASNQPTSLALSWGTSTGATSYEYCYDTSNDGSCSGTWVSTGTSTNAGLGGLAYGTTYYWQVRASNSFGTTFANGTDTAFWAFTTLPNPPGTFGKTSPANGATGVSTSPTLSWSASSGATSYEYCYDTSSDNACSGWTSNGTATSKALSGLTPGTTYYWHVRANNPGGTTYADGSATAFWSFTIQAATSNDDFDYPIVVGSLPYENNQDVAGYTTAIDDPILACPTFMEPGYHTAWYRYTPSQSSTVTISTEGSHYDTVLAVWTGARGSLVNVGCNDDYSPQVRHSQLSMDVSAGTTYYIEIASYFDNPPDTSLTLSITAAATPEPEMDVLGKDDTLIENGDATPSPLDGTDFGGVSISGGSKDQDFLIVNNGFNSLILDGSPRVVITGADAGDFTVIVQPDSPVLPAGMNYTTFTVRFTPSAPGLRTAVISIANNDSDENPYTFTIQGTGYDLPYRVYLPLIVR